MIFKKNIQLSSELSSEQISNRLKRITDKKNSFSNWGSSTYSFEGEISESHFSINRIVTGRNSFVPIIKGTLTNYDGLTKLNLTFKLNTLVKVFLIVTGIFFITIGTIVTSIFSAFDEHFFLKPWMVPLPILLFTTVGVLSFNLECKKAIKILTRIIKQQNGIKKRTK